MRYAVEREIPAAAHAELAGDRGQRQHRQGGVAAVAVPFQPPSAAQDGGGDVGIHLGEVLEQLGVEPGDLGGAVERPRGSAFPELLRPVRVLGQELLVRQVVFEQIAMDGQRHHHIGARL